MKDLPSVPNRSSVEVSLAFIQHLQVTIFYHKHHRAFQGLNNLRKMGKIGCPSGLDSNEYVPGFNANCSFDLK